METTLEIITREEVDEYNTYTDPFNVAADNTRFEDLHSRMSANTIKSYHKALERFREFLSARMEIGDLFNDIQAWRSIRWGMVEGLKRSMVKQGFTPATINQTLSVIRIHAKEAVKANTMSRTEYAVLCTVEGYSQQAGRKMDMHRSRNNIPIRIGKKPPARTVILSEMDANKLKLQYDTPQGRRDTLLLCLLLDHGLRRGEVHILKAENTWIAIEDDKEVGYFKFYRPKVDKYQTHRMSSDTLVAYKRYVNNGDCPETGYLIRSSNKNGTLGKPGMSCGAIYERVAELGQVQGIEGLSPHVCRHYYITVALRNKSNPSDLQQAAGWNSQSMLTIYRDDNAVANDGVNLPEGVLIE